METQAQRPAAEEPYAKVFLEALRQADRCAWCGRDPRRGKNRLGLCGSCNRVRKRLERIEEVYKTDGSAAGDVYLDWERDIAREMKKGCIGWGQMLKGILDGSVSGLSLEGWFRLAAERIARDKVMNQGRATTFGWTFTPEQRQVLAYLFWEMFGAEASHNRMSRAISSASAERRKARAQNAG